MKKSLLTIIVEEFNVNLFTWSCINEGFFSLEIKKFIGRALRRSTMIFEGNHGRWAVDIDLWNDLGRRALRAAWKPSLARTLFAQSEKEGRILLRLTAHVLRTPLRDISQTQLRVWFKTILHHYLQLSMFGFIPVLSDYHHGYLTATLETIVTKRLSQKSKRSVQEYVATLSSATRLTRTNEEMASLYDVARAKNSPRFQKIFEKHVDRFRYVFYGYEGPAWTEEKFLKRLASLLKQSPNFVQAYQQQKNERAHLVRSQEQMVRELRLSLREQKLFETARTFLYLKAYRVDVRSYVNAAFDKLFVEIGRRYGFSLRDLRWTSIPEMRALFQGRVILKERDRKARRHFFINPWIGNKLIFLYGRDAQRFFRRSILREEVAIVSEIKGQVASPGVVRGKVKIVNRIGDIDKCRHGDILVSVATNPDLLPAMYRAAAFVTDTGGITSHAAIVAREMKKPCVIGTKIATKVLKDGDNIEVDAKAGIVRKL